MNNQEENIWENRYQNGMTGWDRGETSSNLNYWLENDLLKPCRILIPGCGNGYEVLALAKLGFDVVAIDIAPTAIENLNNKLAKENLKAELILGDFFTWEPEKKFDAIFEQTSLCALPPKEWATYETQLHRWLKTKGKLFAQFMQTDKEGGPPFHCALNDMEELFPTSRWTWGKEAESQVKEAGKTERLFILEST